MRRSAAITPRYPDRIQIQIRENHAGKPFQRMVAATPVNTTLLRWLPVLVAAPVDSQRMLPILDGSVQTERELELILPATRLAEVSSTRSAICSTR